MMTRQQGFNLIELMISITIGMIIVLATLTVATNASKGYKVNDDNARLNDLGALALGSITDDLANAGFFGEQTSLAARVTPVGDWAAKSHALATCDARMFNVTAPVNGINIDGSDPDTHPCGTNSSNFLIDGSSMITVRFASDGAALAASALNNDTIYLVSSPTTKAFTFYGKDYAALLSNSYPNAPPPTVGVNGVPALVYRWNANAWFLANATNNAGVSNIPTLMKRAVLGDANGTQYQDFPIAEGIERLRFEYGLDMDGLGGVTHICFQDTSTWTCQSGKAGAPTPSTTNIPWENVLSIDVYLLARVPSATDPNTTTFTLGSGGAIPPAALASGFKRRVFATTVYLRNRNRSGL